MKTNKIVLTGTGALSRAISEALAISALSNVSIHVVGRSISRSRDVCEIANARSASEGKSITFIPEAVDWGNRSALAGLLNKTSPGLVIHTASLQSVWSLGEDTRWNNFVRKAGYGVTLPLQCILAFEVASACADMQERPLLVNCCYPDAVNWVLARSGFDVLCGIGNIGLIASFLPGTSEDVSKFRLVASHYHLQQFFLPASERVETEYPRLYLAGNEVANSGIWFDPIFMRNEPSLNAVTALTCQSLVEAILLERTCVLHLPGPLGLPGGYPVQFVSGRLAGIETSVVNPEEAEKWNLNSLEKEGIHLSSHQFTFSPQAEEWMKGFSPGLAAGFDFAHAEEYCREFAVMKESLHNN